MGTQSTWGQIQRMKSLLFLALLAFARSEWTCEECEKVMNTVLESDISEEGIQQQVDILLAEVCPQLEDVDTCVERLPRLWADLSPVMWTFPSRQISGVEKSVLTRGCVLLVESVSLDWSTSLLLLLCLKLWTGLWSM